MKKLWKLLAVSLVMCVGMVVRAGDFEDGNAASENKNYVLALQKYRKSAEQGHAGAQYNLAVMYDYGQRVVQDYSEAVRLYKLSAAQGLSWAQSNLALKYHIGQGVVQDYAEAVRWFKLAAAQGLADAQFNLATSYYSGKGVVQDYVKAHMWANLSAAASVKDGDKKRDAIASFMTPQQIAEAQKMARECQARNFKNCD